LSFVLHPSGFCTWHTPGNNKNLQPGAKCPECNRVAGHAPECIHFKPIDPEKEYHAKSRTKLYDAVSVLWSKSQEKSFVTFTLPSYVTSTKFVSDRSGRSPEMGTYQRSTTCSDTGDLAVAELFSKTLEAWKTKEKRKSNATTWRLSGDSTPAHRHNLSYVWCAEAQMKRLAKYGGVGDLHYHLVVNRKLKHDNGQWHDFETFQWLQDNWNNQLGTSARNCVDVRPIPERITSIPAYLSKYLGKGYQRRIISRTFQATQDLTRYKPIHLDTLPDARMTRETSYTTPEGFDICSRYFNTREVLEQYAGYMHESWTLDVSRGSGKSLTDHAKILDRTNIKFRF